MSPRVAVAFAMLLFAGTLYSQDTASYRLIAIDPSINSTDEQLTLTATLDAPVSVDKDPQLFCEDNASSVTNRASSRDESPALSGVTAAFRLDLQPFRKVNTVRCTISVAGTVLSPALTLDLAKSRRLAELEHASSTADLTTASRYEPPREVFFDHPDISKDQIALNFTTQSCGRVRAQLVGSSSPSAVTEPGVTHRIVFPGLKPGVYAFEAWVVDGQDKEVAGSRIKHDGKGKQLAFEIPENPGLVAITDVAASPRTTSATITGKTNIGSSVQLVVRKVIDRVSGKFGDDQTIDLSFDKSRTDFSIPVDKLEPDAEYDYFIKAKNLVGVETTSTSRTMKTDPIFGFGKGLKLTITPLGFFVSFTPTVKPTKVTLSVLHPNSNDHEDNVIESVPDGEISMSLSPAKTQEFLKLISTEEVVLRVMIERAGVAPVSQDLRVAMKIPTKSDIAALSIPKEQKTALADAAEKYGKSKWGEKWGPTIRAVAEVALGLLK